MIGSRLGRRRSSLALPRALSGWPARTTELARQALANDRLVVASLMLLAAAVRLPGLGGRGIFDSDQGNEMHAFLTIVSGTGLPLLGPGASVGEFHQGVMYFWLLAPFAALSGGDAMGPLLAVAAFGIGAVALTWWLARTIGGPATGLMAGLLMALSPAAILSSTELWSASPLPFFGALAFGAAWHARATGRMRWWVVALGGAGAAWQIHLLGVLVVLLVLGVMLLEWRRLRQTARGPESRRLVAAGIAGLGAIGVLFTPLIVHELLSGFAETQLILAYVIGGGEAQVRADVATRLWVIGLRATSWPFSGVLTDAPLAGIASSVLLGSCAGAAIVLQRGARRRAAALLLAVIGVSVAALAFAAPTLAFVVEGLPTDHYHSFLLPIIFSLAALGLVAIGRRLPLVGIGAATVLLAIQVAHWPPGEHPNSWPVVREGGARVAALVGDAPVGIVGVPEHKPVTATSYPILQAGVSVVAVTEARYVVASCDRLFESLVGAACAGPAEDAAVAATLPGRMPRLVTRFDVSPRIAFSVYER